MRFLVFVLVVLAASKVATQQYLISTTKNEIIIAAYKDRAVTACREAARARRLAIPASWAPASDIRVVIGKSSVDVALWQVDNVLWQARYKAPFLVVPVEAPPHGLFCEFDIAQGAASLVRM
ncbi:MAG: hypothetical protein R3D44_10550 [Hyphomicrobiaceae bacterium]